MSDPSGAGSAGEASPTARWESVAIPASLAVVVLGFVPGLLDPFTPPKAALLRVSGFALLAAAATRALLARGNRQRAIGPAPAGVRLLDAAVAAWVLVGGLAAMAGVSPRLAWWGEIEQREGWLTTVALAGMVVGARRLGSNPVSSRRVLDGLLMAAGVAAAYALLQWGGLDLLRWEHVARYPVPGGWVLRPGSTLGAPIPLAIALSAALAIACARTARGGASLVTHGPLIVLLVFAIAATLSRGAWVAALAGTGVGLALAGGGARPGARTKAGRTALACALAAAAAALVFLPRGAGERLSEGARAEAVSLPARIEIARGALALWKAHPWLGVGPDSFGLEFPSVQNPELWRIEWIGIPVHAHSAVLQAMVTLGSLGTLAGGAWVVALSVMFVSRRRLSGADPGPSIELAAGLLALGVAGAFNPLGLAGAAIFAALSGLLAGGARTRDSHAPPAARSGSTEMLAATAAAVVVLALAFPTVRELRSLAAAGRARAALLQSIEGRPADRDAATMLAVPEARRATQDLPGEDELWRLECDACLAAARLQARIGRRQVAAELAREGEAASRVAVRLEPRRASNHQRLANALAARAELSRAEGRTAADSSATWEPLALEAEHSFDEASRRAPADALILSDRAGAELRLGWNERARATAQRIVAMYPAAATGYALEAASWLAEGRAAEARPWLERARAARWEAEDAARRAAVEGWLQEWGRADSLRSAGRAR